MKSSGSITSEAELATEATADRLMNAMETLVCERGLSQVSVRDVTSLAGVNVSSINYHFGSRTGLILALASRNVRTILEARELALEKATRRAEEQNRELSVEEIVDSLLIPLWKLSEEKPQTYNFVYRVVSYFCNLSDDVHVTRLESTWRVHLDTYVGLVSERLPGVAESRIRSTLTLAPSLMMFRSSGADLLQAVYADSPKPDLDIGKPLLGYIRRFVMRSLLPDWEPRRA